MLRRTLCCLTDSYSAAVGPIRTALLSCKDAAAVQRKFAFLFSQGQITVDALDAVLAGCRAQRKWRHALAVLTEAKRSDIPLQDHWYDATLASTYGDVAAIVEAQQQLQTLWGPVGAPLSRYRGTRRRPAAAGELQTPVGWAQSSNNVAGVMEAVGLPPSLVPSRAESGTTALHGGSDPQVPVLHVGSPRPQSLAPPPSFERFYVAQGVCSGPSELALMVRSMQRRPSLLVRLNVNVPEFPLVSAMCAGKRGLFQVPWYPQNGVVWEYRHDDDALGPTVEGTALQATRYWLRLLTELRLGSLQSASSLLAPLMLPLRSDHAVLDLCASPGSKTTQLLDLMTTTAAGSGRTCGSGGCAGLVVANEINPSRLQDLKRRLAGRYPHAVTTQFDARSYPAICPGVGAAVGGGYFDGVLADVPCSGDGRLHQDAAGWHRWHPRFGLEQFHARQVSILQRALSVVKPGGHVVYSTCTMNPLENEAVVAAVTSEGLARIVPPRTFDDPTLYAMQRGLRGWLVPATDGTFYRTVGEAVARGDEKAACTTLFPPQDARVVESLAHCRRLYPHVHRGFEPFFLAVLQRPSDVHASFPGFGTRDSGQVSRVPRISDRYPLLPHHRRALAHVATRFGISQWPPWLSFVRGPTDAAAPTTTIYGISTGVEDLQAAVVASMASGGDDNSSSHAAGWKATAGAGVPFFLLDEVVGRVHATIASAANNVTLTVDGARLVGPCATRSIVDAPLAVLQQLLTTRRLDVGSDLRDERERMRCGSRWRKYGDSPKLMAEYIAFARASLAECSASASHQRDELPRGASHIIIRCQCSTGTALFLPASVALAPSSVGSVAPTSPDFVNAAASSDTDAAALADLTALARGRLPIIHALMEPKECEAAVSLLSRLKRGSVAIQEPPIESDLDVNATSSAAIAATRALEVPRATHGVLSCSLNAWSPTATTTRSRSSPAASSSVNPPPIDGVHRATTFSF